MKKDFIPKKDAEFDVFQKDFINGAEPNLGRWGIPEEEFSTLRRATINWAGVWERAQNKGTRSPADVVAKDEMRAAYEKFLRLFIRSRMAFNPLVTDADRKSLGLTVRDAKPSPRPAITTQPFGEMEPAGGARIKITLRVQHDSSRANRHPQADSIEMAYSLGTAPGSPESAQKTIVFKRSLYTLSFNMADAGKKVYAYFRWKNESEEAKSGPWSNLMQAVIA